MMLKNFLKNLKVRMILKLFFSTQWMLNKESKKNNLKSIGDCYYKDIVMF